MYDLRCVGVQLYEQGGRVLRMEVYQQSGPLLNDVRTAQIEQVFSCICRALRSAGFIEAVNFFR